MKIKSRILTCILLPVLFMSTGCKPGGNTKYRILTAGIRHESNTFNPYLTTMDQFTQLRGSQVTEGREWAEVLEAEGMEVIPTLHAIAGPSGMVSRETYEAFRDEILEGIRRAGPLNGIYLDMHGALHVEGYEDAQADFIRQIRTLAGEQVLVAASFDLHGNMSEEFVRGLDILSAYRTAPHVDGEETRTRTVKLLVEALRNGYSPRIAHINLPILIPGEKGITSVDPLLSFYEHLPEIAGMEGLMDASIFVGMPWTDVHRAGMSIQVVACNQEDVPAAREEAELLANGIWEERFNLTFDVETAAIDEAIRIAQNSPDSTVFITDSGDNVTAGAAGDGTLVLERLLALKVKDAVLAGIVDPEAVALCAEAGVGAEVELMVGGKIDHVFSKPIAISGSVLRLPMDAPGSEHRDAVLQVDGVTLVLLSGHRAFTDPAHFRAMDIDPLKHPIVVVKEGYLFQELRDIAPRAIMALTPGFANQMMTDLDYQKVRRPIFPLDPGMNWSAGQSARE
jgi:microcystin degradation protein MlrC